ncbi:ArsA family ATPase [Natrialbaceae archaeon AArc-T1-2]|uniref:ArsA family ATPase n=1 Tax=Natrialbaceae archaeon AArc-T1-2 TaxID=3053904 RepID=UPI00255AF5F3|nr:ArsA family ATPase [Natrialbaceae archaeon AArc-T1-2]WIV66508.1 ArsA family ATPase [Natrialbaceae archaeon AArc-T1-2]
MSGLDVEPAEGDEEAGDNTIEVTPTESVDDERETVDVEDDGGSIDGPEYVLYGGKGGVGKTTMAAATALDSARRGVRTLVVSTDPAHSLSDAFDTDVGTKPEPIHETYPLFGVEIDPDAALEEGAAIFGGADESGDGGWDGDDATAAWDDDTGNADPMGGPGAGGPMGGLGGDGPMGGLGEMLGEDSPMEAMFGGTMPGADEAAAMQTLLEYLDDDRFDRVVVDTAPTGHTLRLLQLPEIMDSMVGRIMTMRQRIGSMLEGVKGMFGGETPDEGDDLEDLEELRDRIERLRAALRDPNRTDFRIVLVPEEMSVYESERLESQLSEFDIPVGTVVVNRVMEPLADVTDDVDDEAFLSPDLDECEFCQRRWDVQQAALAEAQDLFRGVEVKRVPLFADEVRGEDHLEVVAACLR